MGKRLFESRENVREKEEKGTKGAILHSTIFRIIAIVIALVLPINIITLVLVQEILKNDQMQMAQEIQNSLDMMAGNLGTDLDRASKRVIYLSFADGNVVELANTSGEEESRKRSSLVAKVTESVKEVQEEFAVIDMIYFQFPSNGYVITNGSPGISRDVYLDTINQMEISSQKYGITWEVLTIDENAVLVSYCNWQKSSFGVMLNLERTLLNMNVPKQEEGRLLFFTNEEENVYSKEGADFLLQQEMTLEEVRESKKYDVYISDLGDYNLKFVEVVKKTGIAENLSVAMKLLGILAMILTCLAIPLLLIYLRRWVGYPLSRLSHAMDKIEQGNLDYRIEEENQGREFERINRNFNSMMEQVGKLKIEVYEQELEKKNITMRYLSQQIQPHFILNAMNILYSYEPEEYALSQKMILCISKYFRYIVKVNAKFVFLHQEMEHIKNYFEIQKARFPGLFYSIVEYEDGLKDALIPPLLVQNFAENSIKYSLKVGNKITIFVVTEYYQPKGKAQCMRIRLADTGEGLSDEILGEIRVFQKTWEPQPHLGVGIMNSIERLHYFYGEDTAIRFWRDENYKGTNVEIILPIHFQKEGDTDYADFIG